MARGSAVCEKLSVVEVSNANRIVFPEIGRTKGEVVRYYERIAPRALPHLLDRPLSIRRFPKGLAGPGFFQKNVPAHYPAAIGRFAVPRQPTRKSAREHEETIYPLVETAEHLAYLANQGAIELHVPTSRATALGHPDRLVVDLDPPSGAVKLVRRAAHLTRELLEELGLAAVPVATGSKGYHVVAAIRPEVSSEVLAGAMHKLGALLAAKHPRELTTAFRIVQRGKRVFIDWLRNRALATVIAPYSLRARPRAPAAVPLAWSELDTTTPDAFGIDDVDGLLDRPDTLADLARTPGDGGRFARAVDEAFDKAGLVLEAFDRFRS